MKKEEMERLAKALSQVLPAGYPFATAVPLPKEEQEPSGASCATCIYRRGERLAATCSNPSYVRIHGSTALGRDDAAGWCCSAWSEEVVEKPIKMTNGIALFDLGQDDVHIPATPKRSDMTKVYTYEFGGKSYECDDGEDSTDMISSEERKSLPTEKFALPEERKYPVDTAARTRNAAARLEQQKGSMSPEKYAKARAAIGRAAKSHGIDSEYNKKKMEDGSEPTEMHFEPDGDELGGPGDGDEDDKNRDENKKMTAGRMCRADGVELSSKSAEGKEIWIQVAKQGKFNGHGSGPFEMNAQTFAEIIHNFSAQKNKAIPVDFEHASEQPAHQGSIPMYGAPAQGWITKLEMRPDGNLWGLVRWGDLAKQYIKAGQYRYLSPAIVFGSKDRVSGQNIGARLSSAALTNNPFLDGMVPLAAKRSESGNSSDDVAKVICKALGLPEFADAALACMTIARIEAMGRGELATIQAGVLRDALRLPLTMSTVDVFAHARIACGEVSPPTSSAAVHETNQPMKPAKQESKMTDEKNTEVSQLTLKLAASEAEKKTLKDESDTKLAALTAENTELKKQLESFQTREVEGRVDMALQIWGEKKGLTAEMRPHLLNFAKTMPTEFNAMYPAPAPGQQRPVGHPVATGPHHVPGPQIGVGGLGPENSNVIRMRDVIAEEKIPSIDVIVARLMKESREAGNPMSRDDAYSAAYSERTNLINAAANKRLGNGG